MHLPNSDQSRRAGPASPNKLPVIRWLILFLTSWVLCGNYWGYDVVAALNLPLEEYLGFGNTYFQYLLSAFSIFYSLPNCVLPFIGGALIDRWGPRSMALIFCSIATLGQFIFTIGLVARAPGYSIFGRILFGMSETLSVAQQRITTKWFRGGELALAIGVNLSVARLGSVINDFVSPVLAHRYSVPVALWAGFLSCAVSLGITVILVIIDRKYSHLCPENNSDSDDNDILMDQLNSPNNRGDDSMNASPVEATDPEADVNQALQRKSPLVGTTTNTNTTTTATTTYGFRQAVWNEIYLLKRGMKTLPRCFWVMQVVLVLLYGTTVPFNNIHSAFLCSKYYPDQQEYAAQVMGVPDTISAILVPFAGYYFDKFGRRARAIIICSLSIFVVHFCLGALPITILPSPIPPLILLGIAYSLLLTFVPVIPLIVPSYFLGTAYGLNTSLANLAWAVFPVVTAGLAVDDPTYFSSEMFFATCGLLAVIASVYVNILDAKDHGGILNRASINSSDGPSHKVGGGWNEIESRDELEGVSSDVRQHISSPRSPRHAQGTKLLPSEESMVSLQEYKL